jgi:BolA protein
MRGVCRLRQGGDQIMSMDVRIKEKLTTRFQPEALDVINESHLHAGHSSSPNSGQSHYRVLIVATAFEGKSRLERHRLVNETLAAELKDGVHALAIRAQTPQEMN